MLTTLATTLSLLPAVGAPSVSLPPITDDPALSRAVAEVGTAFLARRAQCQPGFDRLNVTLLVKDTGGAWRRGSVNPEATAYPASCVKLAYLAAAMHWCRTHGKPYDALDADVRPMMAVSDNVATGRLVDVLTDAPNVMEPAAGDLPFDEWLRRRRYTEDYLSGLGLLGNQRILNKTYPSNSGEMPEGYELRAKEQCGANAMQPQLAASLALGLVTGAIEPAANAHVRDLMAHTRWGGGTPFGFGLPPGTVVLNKAGLAYNTVEDIAYIRLPNGREMVLAAFTNAFLGTERAQPSPHQGSILGVLCEALIERLELDRGCPAKVKVDDAGPGFRVEGEWAAGSERAEAFGGGHRVAGGGAGRNRATWRLSAPEAGWYEVCVWYPQMPDFAPDAPFTVRHADGETTVHVNQQKMGGRWVRLGDFRFERGEGVVTLSDAAAGRVAADAVKAVLWPPPGPGSR